MKIPKQSIRLSPLHPSLRVDLDNHLTILTPLVINPECVLIDGYRRYRLCSSPEIEVIETSGDIFETAISLNLRTRQWNDVDCYLWMRWGRSIGITNFRSLPVQNFPLDLFNAEEQIVIDLTNSRINFRQFVLLCRAASRNRKYLHSLISKKISLNANQTGVFLDCSSDLISILCKTNVEQVFEEPELRSILDHPTLTRRQKGEKLLEEMRNLRYPYYTKKLKEFSSSWAQLKLDPVVQVKKTLFVERGALELSLSVSSYQELKAKIDELEASLKSPHWKKIWEE